MPADHSDLSSPQKWNGSRPTPPERLIAIGDIHGELDKLNRLLNMVSPNAGDQLVFLGDYIDRGKQSRGVIDRLLELKARFPHTVFLRGNHEQMLLDALVEVGARSGPRLCEVSESLKNLADESVIDQFLGNGGNETLRSYRIRDFAAGLPKDHLDFIEATCLWWKYRNFIFVHAGLAAGVPLEEQDPGILLWERMAPAGKDGTIHVVGHQPMVDGKPRIEPGRYYLDTGAAYSQPLTACDVLSMTTWQAR